jgi:hypothetical protein
MIVHRQISLRVELSTILRIAATWSAANSDHFVDVSEMVGRVTGNYFG